MTALATVEILEWRCSSSRAWMLEMCTSTIGPSKAFRASSRAIEVKENAAGLMMMASASVRAACTQSISAPSWLDWWKARDAPMVLAKSRQLASMAASVVVP